MHLLLHYQKHQQENSRLVFALAHVDHRWREESESEAAQIDALAKILNLRFHLKVINPELMKGNLEAACREERYNFFSSLCAFHGYQAVLLAHHADDQAETVLKRVLEGAALPCLNGLSLETEHHGIKLWRPLLFVKKSALEEWLGQRDLKGFVDCTNNDPAFLRGKMRKQIFPMLSKAFGKDVQQSLCFLAEEVKELKGYLDQKIETYLNQIVYGKLGFYLDLSHNCPQSILEVKHLIRSFCEIGQFCLSRDQLEKSATFLISTASNKQFERNSKILYIDRKRLFIQNKLLNRLPKEKIELVLQQPVEYGSWQVEMSQLPPQEKASTTSWLTIWQGYADVVLPKAKYVIAQGVSNALYPRSSSLGKWWTDHKIPAFFRQNIPILYGENEIQHELLTGKIKEIENKNSNLEWIKIRFSFINTNVGV
jgi:tRNA(Ile)-lysidine synthase